MAQDLLLCFVEMYNFSRWLAVGGLHCKFEKYTVADILCYFPLLLISVTQGTQSLLRQLIVCLRTVLLPPPLLAYVTEEHSSVLSAELNGSAKMYMYADAHTGCLGPGGLLTGVADRLFPLPWEFPGSSWISERLNLKLWDC